MRRRESRDGPSGAPGSIRYQARRGGRRGQRRKRAPPRPIGRRAPVFLPRAASRPRGPPPHRPEPRALRERSRSRRTRRGPGAGRNPPTERSRAGSLMDRRPSRDLPHGPLSRPDGPASNTALADRAELVVLSVDLERRLRGRSGAARVLARRRTGGEGDGADDLAHEA